MARILVVDDVPDARHLLARVLRYAGHEPQVAANGQEALDRVNAERPDLILLDVSMPGMSGFEVLEELRDRGELPDLPVIMLTAISDSPSRQRAMRLGARDYFVKAGFDLTDMLKRIDEVVGGQTAA